MLRSSIALALIAGIAIGARFTELPFGAPSAPQAQSQLEDPALKTMLEGLGYEAKPLSKGFLIVEKPDDWTINMQVVLSGDKNKIGVNANLGQVPDPDAVTAAEWRALLVANGDIDPSAFYFDEKQKKLYLHRSFDNRAQTPAALKREIQNFARNVKETAQLWKFVK